MNPPDLDPTTVPLFSPLFGILLLVAIAAVLVWVWWRSPYWRPTESKAAKTLIDGTTSNGLLMVRRVDGRWEYRAMTSQEERDYFEEGAF